MRAIRPGAALKHAPLPRAGHRDQRMRQGARATGTRAEGRSGLTLGPDRRAGSSARASALAMPVHQPLEEGERDPALQICLQAEPTRRRAALLDGGKGLPERQLPAALEQAGEQRIHRRRGRAGGAPGEDHARVDAWRRLASTGPRPGRPREPREAGEVPVLGSTRTTPRSAAAPRPAWRAPPASAARGPRTATRRRAAPPRPCAAPDGSSRAAPWRARSAGATRPRARAPGAPAGDRCARRQGRAARRGAARRTRACSRRCRSDGAGTRRGAARPGD